MLVRSELDSDCRLRPILAALTIALTPNPRMNRSRIIWPDTTKRALSLVGLISPNPTVENTVTVKYKASVRERSSWLKFPVPNVDIVKYVEANRTRKSGTVAASASIARMPGNSDLMIRRISQTTTAMNTIDPTTTRSHEDNPHSPSTGAM